MILWPLPPECWSTAYCHHTQFGLCLCHCVKCVSTHTEEAQCCRSRKFTHHRSQNVFTVIFSSRTFFIQYWTSCLSSLASCSLPTLSLFLLLFLAHSSFLDVRMFPECIFRIIHCIKKIPAMIFSPPWTHSSLTVGFLAMSSHLALLGCLIVIPKLPSVPHTCLVFVCLFPPSPFCFWLFVFH